MILLNNLDWLGFAVIILALMAISFRQVKQSQDFLVAGRSVGLFALIATLVMTEFNTSTLLAFSAAGYTAGPMAISLPLVFLIGLSWYTVSVSREWKRLNALSVAELFTQKYGKGLGQTASFFLLLAMTGFSATYVKSMTLIFTPWLPSLSPWILSGLLSLLVIAMTLSGGLLSVIRVDILSFLITLILFPALLIIGLLKFNIRSLSSLFPPDQLGFHPIAQWNHPSLPFWFVTSLIVLTVFTYICSPWYGQKIFSAKNEKTAFMAVGITSLLVFCLYGSALLAASFFKLESPSLTDPQRVVPAMIQTWLPPFFRGGAYAILFAAAMTTLAGVWSTMVAMGVSDFRIISKKVSSERWLTLLFALLSWLGANLVIDNILNRLILANIPIAALSFALLAGFHWKKVTPLGAWASVVIGFLWGLGCFIFIGESGGYTWYWALYGIPLIFVTGTIVSLFTNFLKKDRLSL